MLIKTLSDDQFSVKKVTWIDEDNNQEYVLGWTLCINPFCACSQLTVHLSREKRSPTLASFKLDMMNYEATIPSETEANSDLSTKIVKSLTDTDLEVLEQIFYSEKRFQELDLLKPDVDLHQFPIQRFVQDEMIGYQDIFPNATTLFKDASDFELYLLDDYCINQDCDCSNATLTFISEDEDTSNTQATTIIDFDYKKLTWQARVTTPNHPKPEALIAALTQSNAHWQTDIIARAELLKTLLQRFQTQCHPPKVRTTPKIGRNDPCTCGSGQKYKKCCGK